MAQINPDAMQYVCEDGNNTQWKYNPDNDHYYRLYPDKKFTKIRRQSIPDPEVLRKNKIKALKGLTKGISINEEALRPTPAIYALWHHSKLIDNPKK